ncbi:MAG: Na/Pi cotransporter family protein [Burkholderiales bacterium]
MEVLLNVLAGVALLVWGTHLVRTGILRVYGGNLRQFLVRSVSNRFTAFAAGMGVTSLLQSSTATALITTSFVGGGLIATAPALAVMLGADVGTALVVQLLSLKLSWLWPLLVVVGVALTLGRKGTVAGRYGRIVVGLGLILLALQHIVAVTKPLAQTQGLKVIFASLTGDVLLDILIAAGLTLLCYSSLAVVLLTAAFTATGMIPPQVALGLVLGANLGSGCLAMLATTGAAPEARRVSLGNLFFKLTGCALMIPLLPLAGGWLAQLDPAPQRQIVNFHLAFNVCMAVLFIGFTQVVARLTERLLPSLPVKESPATPRYLDPVALETPTLAISCAAREALRLGDMIETMLRGILDALKNNDAKALSEIHRMDDDVDDLYTSIKLYLTQVSRDALEEKESRRWADIISFTINLEHVGDILDKNLLEMAEKKIKKRLQFSAPGLEEICALHARVVSNLQLSLNVFVNGDLKSAQRLLSEKEQVRDLERAYADSHLQRLSDNTLQSVETSALHLDIIRDLKRINSHICSVAYPILEEAGVLAPSRLREVRRRARSTVTAKPAAVSPAEGAEKA